MKQLSVTIRISNNLIKQRRLELGLSQARLAECVGIHAHFINGLESMRVSPLKTSGEWKSSAVALAEYFGVAPETLFPEEIVGIETTSATKQIDVADAPALLGAHSQRLLSTPLELMLAAENREELTGAIDQLAEQERDVINRRFGLLGSEPETLSEIGDSYSVSETRISQIESKALRKFRYMFKQLRKDPA